MVLCKDIKIDVQHMAQDCYESICTKPLGEDKERE